MVEAIEAAGIRGASKRRGAPLIFVLLAGITGSLAAVAAFGRDTVTVAPLKLEVSVGPAASGSTRLTPRTHPNLQIIREFSAPTHTSLLKFGASVVGVDAASAATAVVCSTPGQGCEPLNLANPESVARYVAENGQSELRAFAIKLAAIAFGGGFALALIVALGNFKRAVAGAIAGLIGFGILGLLAKQTYDTTQFRNTRFAAESRALSTLSPAP